MEDDDFTFCQVGLPADKEHLEAQLAVLKIDDIRIKEDFSDGAGDSQIDTVLWKDKSLDDTSLKKQGTNGSFSSNVIDIKDDFSDGADDSQIGTILWKDKSLDDTSLDKQGTVGSLSFNVIDMSTPKTDLPKQTASPRSKDSGKGSQEQMIPTKKPTVRAKVPFEKGYSQMDWLKLTRTHPDLAGLKGESNKRLISIDEVKQHKTEGSIWTVLKGRVYNIAPYMKFHPGGVDMLMKGAGKDCTSLFNKYHAWVNAEFLLEKCLVGTLDESR